MRGLLCVGLLFLLGKTAAAAGPGTTTGDFLRLGVGARAVALGEAYVGLADDADALFYNPAGIGFLQRQELSLMHDEFGSQVHHEWLAYALPTDAHGVFGASADAVYVEPFASYDQFDQPTGQTSAMDGAYALAYAFSPTAGLAIGGSAKLIRSRLDTVVASGAAADLGVLFHPLPRLGIGASLLNAGGGLRYIDQTFPLPTAFKTGLSWRAYEDTRRKQALTFAVDGTAPRNESPYVSGGAELVVYDALTLRAGGRSNQDAGIGFAGGVGIEINRGEKDKPEIDFDYAFVEMGLLSQAHRASIKIKFGRRRNDAGAQELRWEGGRRRPAHGAWTERKAAAPEEKPKAAARRRTPPVETDKEHDLLTPLIWVNP